MTIDSMPEAAGRRADSPHFREVVDVLAQSGRKCAFQTALRTRSPLAVQALAELASPGRTVDDLVALAHEPRPDSGPEVDPGYLCALAGVLYSRERFEDSHAMYSMASRHLGGSVQTEHQVWFARSALCSKGSIADLPPLTELDEIDRLGLEADEAHPSAGGDETAWLEKFRRLTGMPDLTLSDDPSVPYLDRLETAPVDPIRSEVRISIIMTCYRPGRELLTAVRSVLAQSWRNWELLIVDDRSGDEFLPILSEVRCLDKRIKLLMLPRNSGTYEARNRALAECSGSLVTGLDSDDWAHPHWLERQARPLLDDWRKVMSVSSGIRVHSDLTVTGSSRAIRGPRSTSIMFKAHKVRKGIGFFDSVRKGADTEFRMRIAAVFGNRAVARLTDTTLTLVRLGDETLTSSEFGMGWLHPARWAYQSAQKAWHRELRAKTADPFVCAGALERPFFAPDRANGQAPKHPFDQVFVTDFRFLDERQDEFLLRAVTAAEAGKHVGLMHLETLLRPMPHSKPFDVTILRKMHAHGIAFVSSTDPIETEELVVADPSLWEGRGGEYGLSRYESVEIGPPTFGASPWTESEAEEAERSPSTSIRGATARAPRPRRLRLRRHGISAMVSALLGTAAAWLLLGPPAAYIASFLTLAVGLFGMYLLTTPGGYLRLMAAVDRRTSN